MDMVYSFGEWIRRRRNELRLTQREVATRAYCSTAMIKKLEADERKPSPELAESLANVLAIGPETRQLFVAVARGERPADNLGPATQAGDAVGAREERASRLPSPATPFVGRGRELKELLDLLRQPEVRLVTLLGPGGIGKTRLALQAARTVQDDHDHGAFFVPLATVSDRAQLPQAIAEELQLPLTGGETPETQLQHLLRRRRLLLVLDNFEQLVPAAALLSALLSAAPGLQLLVTSRERLNLLEEWLVEVQALEEAAALFNQSARRVKADFDPQSEEAAVADICRLVNGHPLALQLAASWRRFMPCSEIARRIRHDLDFLGESAVRGPQNVPQRHRSMGALFDHSWELLSHAEQKALARLSIFRGGFEAQQANAVAGASWPLLLGLVDKSLLQIDEESRFDLHELTRYYAYTKLAGSGKVEATCLAHLEAFALLANEMALRFTGPQAIASRQRVEQEFDNFRAALAWGIETKQVETVLRLVHHLFHFWLDGGYWQEGEQWLARAIAAAPDDDAPYLAIALTHLSTMVALQGRFVEASPLAQRAHNMARRLEEPWPLVQSLRLMGQALSEKEGSLAAFEEAIAICRQHAGESQYDTFLYSLLHLRGDRFLGYGMHAEARAGYEESLAGLRALGDVNRIAYPLGNLGRMALYDGRLQEALELIAESVTIAHASGNRVSVGDWLYRLGQVQLYLGQLDDAEANLGETLRLYEEVGNQFGPPGVLSNLALVALARGDVQAATAWIRECFDRFRKLKGATRQIDPDYNLLQFLDALDSVLHAGLVAHARGDWQSALGHFRLAESNRQVYPTLRPLQEMVLTAVSDIQSTASAADYAEAVALAEKFTLDSMLASWLD